MLNKGSLFQSVRGATFAEFIVALTRNFATHLLAVFTGSGGEGRGGEMREGGGVPTTFVAPHCCMSR